MLERIPAEVSRSTIRRCGSAKGLGVRTNWMTQTVVNETSRTRRLHTSELRCLLIILKRMRVLAANRELQ